MKACDEKKCQNGGKCQEDGSDEYDCLCPIGYTGKNCECNYTISVKYIKIIANRIV